MALKSVVATPNAFMSDLTFEADCTVGTIDRGSSLFDSVKVGDRVVRVRDAVVVDRAELRAALCEYDDFVPIDVYLQASADRALAAARGGIVGSPEDLASGVTLNDGSPVTVAASPDNNYDAAELAAEAEEYRLHVAACEHASAASAGSDNSAGVGSEGGTSSVGSTGGGGDAGLGTSTALFNVLGQSAVGHLSPTTQDTIRTKLMTAVREVPRGRAVIVIGDFQFSPLHEIECLSRDCGAGDPTTFDLGVKLKHRIAPERLAEGLANDLKVGKWVVVIRATKCISLLSVVADFMKALHETPETVTTNFHEDARLIVCAEPHPHFPELLTHKCKSMRLRTDFSSSRLMFESIGTSISVRRSATEGDGNRPSSGKRVRMATVVSVVDIEPREAREARKPSPPARVNVAGTVTLSATFAALPGDKFYGVCFAGRSDRVAICSSLGNLYLVDTAGASLASYHLHDAAVWGLDFASESLFATGAEDQAGTLWERDAADSVHCIDSVPQSNDVYCTLFTEDKQSLVIGGLMTTVGIKSLSPGGSAETVALSTSVQAMSRVGANVVCGGGDGSVNLLDCSKAAIVSTAPQHSKKAAAIATFGEVVVSGSYDGRVRMWDTRTQGQQNLQCLKFTQYVTGLAVDGNYMAASVGECLYLWDVRNLGAVLGGHPRAWVDVNRGLCIDGSTRTVVSASPDGQARFWTF